MCWSQCTCAVNSRSASSMLRSNSGALPLQAIQSDPTEAQSTRLSGFDHFPASCGLVLNSRWSSGIFAFSQRSVSSVHSSGRYSRVYPPANQHPFHRLEQRRLPLVRYRPCPCGHSAGGQHPRIFALFGKTAFVNNKHRIIATCQYIDIFANTFD